MENFTTFSSQIIYLLTFLIVLAETGIVVCFFLPGDTLLFTLGLLAKSGNLELPHSVSIVIIASFLGNLLGYAVGQYVIAKKDASRFLKKIPESHIKKTEEFYTKYGAWTVVLSRFVPVVRTVAPFLAGVAKMNRKKFTILSLAGGVVWATVVILSGYLFGSYINLSQVGLVGLVLMLLASILTPIFLFIIKKYF
jgi:membrane-associated protein